MKITFNKEYKEIECIKNRIEEKLSNVQNENDLSLDNIKKLKDNVDSLLAVLEEEILNWM